MRNRKVLKAIRVYVYKMNLRGRMRGWGRILSAPKHVANDAANQRRKIKASYNSLSHTEKATFIEKHLSK